MGSVVIVFQSRCLTHSSLARNPIMATASADPGFRLTGMTKGLQWNVVVLFPRIFQRLVAQLPQSQSDAPPSGVRLNHLVNEALAGRNEWIGEAGFIFLGAFRNLVRAVHVLTKDNLHRPFCTHYCDLCGRPGIVKITAQMLG